MIAVNGISVSFGAETLLKDISFIVNKSEKIALTGKNGAGKSTLLKIIAGIQDPSEGNVSRQNDITIGYLPQQMPVSDTTTLLEETRKAFSDKLQLSEELERLHRQIEAGIDYNDPKYEKILGRIETLNNILAMFHPSEMEAEMEQTLQGLGFTKKDFSRHTSEFSGGWRMRVELAKILLGKPDILLLDEPTNHLDIESIQWLENFLKQKNKTLLLVSHDRAFLDNVTTRTIDINCGKAYDYKVNYSEFVKLRKERLEQQLRAYENQQKQIADIKDFIERFRYKATKAVQVQSRIKQLEKIVPIEIDQIDNSRLNLKFPPSRRSGDFPLIIEDVAKNYGTLEVFNDVTFTLHRGDKVAFVGKNGEGKSTLVKCIMNEIEYSGSLKVGHNVDIGYFAQNQAQLLDESLTVFETVDQVATGDIRSRLKDILGAFLFRGQDIDKKVSVLSGGEKTRLAMIKLMLQPVNFLIMDEPTNHLDMQTKEILKEALMNFDGTLILVSHDRDFLDGLVSKVYEFGNKKVKEHLGGVYDFLYHKRIADLKSLEKVENAKVEKREVKSDARLSYQEQKEREKVLKKAEKRVSNCEKLIEQLEEKIKQLEVKIGDGDHSEATLKEYDDTSKKLELTMSEWEEATEELEELRV